MIRNKVVEGGPALRIPAHLSFGQHIIDCLRKYGESDDVALINGDNEETTSYKEILQGTVDVALGLQKLGVRKGDVIALCGENIAEYIISALGAVCSGATITTLNLMYTEDELKHVLSISKPKYIFCSEAAIKLHLKTLKSIPSLVKIIQLNGIPSRSSILPFSALKVPGDVKTYQPSNLQSGHDTVYILYSSGTTGLPKGVMLTHINTLYSTALFESEVDLDDPSAVLSIAPWYHAYGLMATTNDILVKRKLVYFSSGFNPQKYLGCIQKYKTRALLAVPPIVVFLAKSPLIDQYDLSSVEIVWCGAAPLSSETIQAALKRLPNCKGVFQGYGMTETALTATKDKHDVDIRKPGCGGYPMPGLKIKVVNIETREKLGPYAEGEVCITGPTIMKGYLGNRKETKDMFDEEGFMKTGDIGYYDNEGCFFIVDRLKELIKYKGYQVAPAAVESVILQHSGVAECGVVGKPDEKVGELPVAFVVPKPGVELTPKDILDFTNDKLSSSSRLHGGVIIVKEIPKNQSGKILRRVLKQHFKTGKKSKL